MTEIQNSKTYDLEGKPETRIARYTQKVFIVVIPTKVGIQSFSGFRVSPE